MNADNATNRPGTIVREQIRRNAEGVILFDRGVSPQVDHDWFDPDHWRRHGVLQSQPGGRGGVAVIDTPAGECVLRHYRRGGAIAVLMGDRYLWTGAARTRCFREFRLLQALCTRGLPVPEPVAVRYRRRGLWYSADLITRRILRSDTLAVRMTMAGIDSDLAGEVGALVARFHREGVWHADLNAHNVLVGPDGLYLIDFDRGRFRPVASGWRLANLQRLRRSLLKLGAADGHGDGFERDVWAPLLRGYERTFGA
ncbi:3-deoxy-D-manno-octulosonic acid kinase [Dyella sp.]|jgi:3-deoxy-D-manno-octulosonic acid kinase|uniref:3-deoxy-D-manno-octulosonic acid kinase n=1 Tax=Dyella sp. TaxID=1869338 RepID=UPI002D782210|nr:3-deoxy-D-manno-octulosonic acid kinase [Dyella sp.]HET6433912.1 3-deoxy-D-manno-octulosonic acid kinase [Dyella sp.]